MNESENLLLLALCELIKKTVTELPEDVSEALKNAHKSEFSSSQKSLECVLENADLAKKAQLPLCQDTGSLHFFVEFPLGLSQEKFKTIAMFATKRMMEAGLLRDNKIAPGFINFYFEEKEGPLRVELLLKGGGSENVSLQYALPCSELSAKRDLAGVKKVILQSVFKAQGEGCAPGSLGVVIGGTRGTAYTFALKQFLRKIDDLNPDKELSMLEREIVNEANTLGIGPLGLGGKTTLLSCKIARLEKIPANFFVTVSYMCHAFRRQGLEMENNFSISRWI